MAIGPLTYDFFYLVVWEILGWEDLVDVGCYLLLWHHFFIYNDMYWFIKTTLFKAFFHL